MVLKNKIMWAFKDKVEDFLPSKYKIILKNFSYIFALQIFQQIASAISFFVIIAHLPKEAVGHYHFILSVLGIVSITSLPGMRTAIMQSVARGNRGFYVNATKYCFLISFTGSAVLFLISGYYYLYLNNLTMSLGFLVAAFFMPFTKGLMTWKSSYVGKENFKILSFIDAVGATLVSVFLMLSVLLYDETFIILLFLALSIPAIQNLLLTYLEIQKSRSVLNEEDGMIEYGLKTSAYNIMPLVAQEIDRISIYNFVSASELAAYNVAQKIPDIFKTIFRNFAVVIAPDLAKTKTYTKKLNRYFTLISSAFLLFSLLFCFTLLDNVFFMLTPTEYHEALPYAQALLIAFTVGNFGFFKSKYIYAQKNIGSNRSILIASNIVKLLLTPLLVFFFQIWGAITAIILQRLFVSMYVNVLIRKYHI